MLIDPVIHCQKIVPMNEPAANDQQINSVDIYSTQDFRKCTRARTTANKISKKSVALKYSIVYNYIECTLW